MKVVSVCPNLNVRKWIERTLVWMCGPGSVAGIATGYGLDGPGIEFRCGRDFPHLSRPALGPTQPPVQWGTGSFSRVKSGRGVTLTPHPLLVPWSWEGRAMPLLPLWAVRPVQSLSACTRVTFTFFFLPLVWMWRHYTLPHSCAFNCYKSVITIWRTGENVRPKWRYIHCMVFRLRVVTCSCVRKWAAFVEVISL